MKTKIDVVYHDHCYDGFGAAFAAWKHLGEDAHYIACQHGEEVPYDQLGGKTLYIVDFSWPKDILETLSKMYKKIIIIDHHKTAQESLNSLDIENIEVNFDMTKSGALMTWEYFHEEDAPKLIQYISDRDLWKFELPDSAAVHAGLQGKPMRFDVWDGLISDPDKLSNLITTGSILLTDQQQRVERICKEAYMTDFFGDEEIPVVNTSVHWSEIGNTLCKMFPDAPFAASFTVKEDTIMFSLRSIGDFDVSAIAKKFGGGGHKNAAGFQTPKTGKLP